jgi:hypothetical protein
MKVIKDTAEFAIRCSNHSFFSSAISFDANSSLFNMDVRMLDSIFTTYCNKLWFSLSNEFNTVNATCALRRVDEYGHYT